MINDLHLALDEYHDCDDDSRLIEVLSEHESWEVVKMAHELDINIDEYTVNCMSIHALAEVLSEKY